MRPMLSSFARTVKKVPSTAMVSTAVITIDIQATTRLRPDSVDRPARPDPLARYCRVDRRGLMRSSRQHDTTFRWGYITLKLNAIGRRPVPGR